MEKKFFLSKRQLRRAFRLSFDLESGDLFEANLRLTERIVNLDFFKGASQIGLYAPLPGEPRLGKLFRGQILETKSLYLPKLFQDNLVYLLWDPACPLIAGFYGILEPLGGAEWKPLPGDILLIPGVAFDLRGNRLGRGKGFFDKFLATLPSYVRRVGVTFESSLVERLPVDPWDQPMDVVVTEKRVLQFRDARKQA